MQRLHRWLSVGSISVVLGGGAFFVPVGLIAGALLTGAVVFTPLMLRELVHLGKTRWVVAFAVVVGGPVVAALLLATGGVSGLVIQFLPLIAFFGFTWVLRHSVGEWIAELEWTIEQEEVGSVGAGGRW